MKGFNDEDIVISGISGENPNSDDIKTFMENLLKGNDLTTTDHKKWTAADCPDVSNRLAVISNLDKCDIQFFGVNRKTAHSLDPITRRFLEHCLQAVLDAGISPGDLKGSKTGVIFTAAVLETEMNLTQGLDQDSYAIMGKTRTLSANRVSYWLDLKGPSYALDCGWNGGLQAIIDATHFLRHGIADTVILGSGNSVFNYHPSYQYNKLGLLSSDGVTRPFDAEASGYGRSEAVNVLVLQRAKDAKRIYGSIVHAMNECMSDHNNLIYEQVKDNWLSLLENFYTQCKVNPKNVSYLEAYGSGNFQDDADELNAVGEWFCDERTTDDPLLIGSVKGNIGHAEGASSIVSIIKLAITANSGKIPPTINYKTPNPTIRQLLKGNMQVVTEAKPLEGDYLALNSFSLGGQYGHLLFKRNPKEKTKIEYQEGEFPRLITVAARTDEGVVNVFEKIEKEPYDPEYYNLINQAFSQGLTGYMYRGFTVLPTQEKKIQEFQNHSGEKRPVWFVFTGMGCQWATMGRDLMALPVFRKSIEISHNLLKPKGLDLIHIITHDDPTMFDNVLNCFVGIVSIQIAMVDLLRLVGITPDGLIGHSVGEVAASYCDGCSTHEQTLLTAYYRGKVSLEGNIISGKMAAVGLGYQAMKDRVPEGIEVACHNASDSCTLSGPSEMIEKYVAELQSQGVFAKAVNAGGIPYHSQYIQRLGPMFTAALRHLYPSPKRRSAKWISSSVPEERWHEESSQIADEKYHANNLLSSVLFEEAAKHIPDKAVLLEIGPHGILQAILRRSHSQCTNIAAANRLVKNQQISFLQALGRLYMNGVPVNISALYPPVTYPVSRETSFLSHLATWEHSESWLTFSDMNSRLSSHRSYDLRAELSQDLLTGQALDGVAIVPNAVYLMLVWRTFAEAQDLKQSNTRVEFKDILFHNDVPVTDDEDLTISVSILIREGNFDVVKNDTIIVSGVIRMLSKPIPNQTASIDGSESDLNVASEDFYRGLADAGHTFDTNLRPVVTVSLGETEWRGQIEHQRDWFKYLTALLQIRIMLASFESSSNKIFKIKKIFQLLIDPEISHETLEVKLDLVTKHLNSENIEMRDVEFTASARTPITFASEDLNTPTKVLPPSKNISTKISYIQYHGENIEGKQVSFSGTLHSKGKIMGLALAEEDSLTISEDPILTWKIPTNWTLEEAVTIPLNYLLAYSAIHLFGDFESDDRALITDGLNKVGIACLRVALQITSNVHTIVNSEEEKAALQKLLPKLSASNIIVNKGKGGQQLCLLIRKYFPKGVDLLINTGEPEIFKASLPCVMTFGKVIELSEDLFQERGKLENTSALLDSTSIYACGGTHIIKSHEEDKKRLKTLLLEGIINGVVIPIKGEHSRDWRNLQTIRMEAKQNTTEKYSCEPDKTYMILGGDASSWLSMTEWFINRKAKNVIIVHQDKKLNRMHQHKLKNLQAKANLIERNAEKISPELIKHIFEVARTKITLTVLLPNKESGQINDDVLLALAKQDTFLVTVIKEISTVLERPEFKTRSKPSLTIVSNGPINKKIGNFLESFDRLLTLERSDVIKVSGGEFVIKRDNDLGDYLPKSLEEVYELSENHPTEVTLTELQTKGLHHDKVREIVPLFIIPGITSRQALVSKFANAIHPVLIVDCPTLKYGTLEEYAELIAPKLKSAASGPFSILGEGWGGAAAMATARVLESMGEKTQVFLLSALPEDLEKYQFGSDADADEAILSRLFNYQPNLTKGNTWRDRMSGYTTAISPEKRIVAEEVLNSIRGKVESLRTADLKVGIKGPVHCFTRSFVRHQATGWMSKTDHSITIISPSKPLLDEGVLRGIQENILIKKRTKDANYYKSV